MSDNNDFGTFFAGLIVGGLVGAAVALLLAPQSGEETRTMIHDKSIELKDRAVEYGADARARAAAALEDARVRADQALEEVRYRTDELARVTREKVGGAKPAAPAEAAPAEEPPAAV
jgi:gas vesicle protein